MKRQTGFTMLELVITMLLISILAVTVLPKLFGSSEFSSYTIRDQLISQLRLVQLQALNRRGVCHSLIITINKFGPVNNSTAACGTAPDLNHSVELGDITISVELDGVTIDVAGNNNLDFRFDTNGRVASIDGGDDCGNTCVINIIGSETVYITIESEGYIHAS